MIFDNLGLPKDMGASDLQDSARLAGLAVVFGFDLTQNKRIPLEKYVMNIPAVGLTHYVRHPLEHKYDFSRDQAICLIAGLGAQGKKDLVNKSYIDGKDIFSPSHRGHIKRCQGKKPNLLEEHWLWLDVLYSCFYQPMGEPNQLLCMLMLADPKYLKFWLKYNKHWRAAIKEYWCEAAGEWRGERELASHMIAILESKV